MTPTDASASSFPSLEGMFQSSFQVILLILIDSSFYLLYIYGEKSIDDVDMSGWVPKTNA